MMKITFIVGLPCSGRTYLGNHVAKNMKAVFIDNISLQGGMTAIKDKSDVTHFVITDDSLCQEEQRQQSERYVKAIYPDSQIEYVFIENNVDKCMVNLEAMPFKDEARELLEKLSKIYTIPEGYVPLSVYDCEVL